MHHELRRIPGEPAAWLLFIGDTTMFAIFFMSFTLARQHHPEVFRASQAGLYQWMGLTNTLLLLSSSYLVALALASARRGDRRRSSYLFLAALTLGIGFATVKLVEWSLLIDKGYRAANQFFVYYFSLTGLHFMHTCAGLAVLAALAMRIRRATPDAHGMRLAESGCGYWHLVDLVWIIMFSILYLPI